MAFLTDTFTDTDGVLLENHSGEIGAMWSRAFGLGDCLVFTNRIYFSSPVWFTSSGSPATPDYHVEAVFRKLSVGANGHAAITVRHEGGTHYAFGPNGSTGTWRLHRFVSGGSTLLDDSAATFSANTDYTGRLAVSGSTLTGYVDGLAVVGVIDTTINSVGNAGVIAQANNSSTAGFHVASILADDGTPTTIPAISDVEPNSGTPNGGTSVVITGANFTDVTTVSFGPTPASSFVIDSDTQITAVSPPGNQGEIVDISVATVDGTSADTSADDYNYDPPVSAWTTSNIKILS